MDSHVADERLANQPEVERLYEPNRGKMLQALRIVLGLPRTIGGDDDGPGSEEDTGGAVPAR